MHSAPKIIIAILVIAAAVSTACTGGAPKNTGANSADQSAATSNSRNSNAVKNDIDELEMLIKLPFHPEEADWREEPLGKPGSERVPGPTDKKLVAVLRFLKEDAAKIAEQAEKHKTAAPESITTENWYPAELIAQSQTSGDETLKGLSYRADDFYNAPYLDGKITRIEGTDYFVLELYTK